MSALCGGRRLVFDAILVLAAGGLATGLLLAGGKTPDRAGRIARSLTGAQTAQSRRRALAEAE